MEGKNLLFKRVNFTLQRNEVLSIYSAITDSSTRPSISSYFLPEGHIQRLPSHFHIVPMSLLEFKENQILRLITILKANLYDKSTSKHNVHKTNYPVVSKALHIPYYHLKLEHNFVLWE